MTNKEYSNLIELGFDIKQINQLENLSNLYGESIENLSKIFEPAHCDENLLRKLNNALKNEYISPLKIKCIIQLIKQDINFEPILKAKSDYKTNVIYAILLNDEIDYSQKLRMSEIANYDNVDSDIVRNVIWMDEADGIDTSKYLKENFTKEQIYLAQEAYKKGYDRLLKVVDKIEDGFDDAEMLENFLKAGFDMVKISNTQNPRLIDKIMDKKMDGVNVDKFLTKESNIYELNYVSELIERNFDDDTIKKMLVEVPIHKYHAVEKQIPLYVDLYQKGGDPIRYLKCHSFNNDYLQKLQKIYENLEKKEISIFEGHLYQMYELKLMEKAINCNRIDVLKAVINIKSPSERSYHNLEILLDEDFKNNKKSPLIKLLYDKGNDIFNDYKNTFEFSPAQKNVLTNAIINGIDYDDIEVIRDSNIDDKKMHTISNMLQENLDIDLVLKYQDILSSGEILSIYICQKAGFTVTDENLRNKDIKR